MNRNGHSSPVNHTGEGKPHKILEKLKITSGKSTLFEHLVHICISLNTNDISPILHTGLTLGLSYFCSRIFSGSALVLGRGSEKEEKKKSVRLVSREGKLF